MSNFDSKDGIWITWERQPRNVSMAKLLNIPLHELIVNQPRIIKYPILLFKTVFLILKSRPRFLFVQNPSIVLSFFAVVIGVFFPIAVVVDAHNSGIYPLEGRSRILNFFAKKIIGLAHAVIVTNQNIANYVANCGGNAIVFPDPLPDYQVRRKLSSNQAGNKFLFICTWAEDEPFLEVIDAFSSLGNDFILNITGNYKKKLSVDYVESLPLNINLLGFVSEERYQQELANCDFTIDLTLRSNCLVCGAYESIAMEVPAIVSDTQVNRDIFNIGFVYTENLSKSIQAAAIECVARRNELNSEIKLMKESHNIRIEMNKFDLIRRISKEKKNEK